MELRDIWFLRRNLLCILAFGCFFTIYALRINFNIAIISMTNARNIYSKNDSYIERADFRWNSNEKGYVLSSFFFGYLASQLAGNWNLEECAGTTVFGVAIFFSALLHILTPIGTYISIHRFALFRFAEGLFEGISLSVIHAMWARYAPPEERTKLLAFAASGTNFASIICPPLFGFMISYWSWSSVFYLPGIAGALWCSLWVLIVKECPENDPRITSNEVKHLQNSAGRRTEKRRYPWKAAMNSTSAWALFICNFAEDWGHFTMFIHLPMFLNDLWSLDIETIGVMSAIPYIPLWFGSIVVGLVASGFKKYNISSICMMLKVLNTATSLGQAGLMILLVHCNYAYLAIIILTTSVTIRLVTIAIFYVNCLCMAPQYASMLMGLSSIFGCLACALSPLVTGHIITNKSKSEWDTVFLFTSLIYVTAGIFYALIASTEIQPWALEDDFEDTEKNMSHLGDTESNTR